MAPNKSKPSRILSPDPHPAAAGEPEDMSLLLPLQRAESEGQKSKVPDSLTQPGGDDVADAGEGSLDPSVVAHLYLEHGEDIRRFLIGVVRDPHLAADVLQATFAKLVQRGHETREETRKAWLFRVAYHEAMYARRRGAVGSKVLQQVAWMRPEESAGADEPLLRFEAVDRVRKALEQLPADQRQLVRMRIYEEKTFAVIAEELQIPLGTALGRMRTALQKLKLVLDEESPTSEK